MLLQALGVMPAYLWDLLVRLWPLLLIIFGLAALVSRRTPTTVALLVIAVFALVVVVFAAGYTRQALVVADANRQTIDVDLQDAGDIALTLDLSLTELTIDAQEEATGRVTGEFSGSTENALDVSYTRRGTQGDLRITEQNVNPIPLLEDFGSNRLTLHLPPEQPMTLDINGNVGNITLDLSRVDVRPRLDVRASLGDVTVTLPDAGSLIGDIATGQGDVRVHIPASIPVVIKITRGVGGGLQIPTGFQQLATGEWITEGFRMDEIRTNLNVGATFGDIVIAYISE
ncbi:MAG: hypothetical protein M5R40_21025 [Anaerolineae bacterium]|nr:hypothetical protein [Anaerolineae bacterium]